MARVKVKVPDHDCVKPNMVKTTVRDLPRGWFRRLFNLPAETVEVNSLKALEAQWTCECGAVWAFHGMPFLSHGWWECVRRPADRWEWVDI